MEYGTKIRECPCPETKLIPKGYLCLVCNGTNKVVKLKRNRERAEAEVKLEELGLEIPWDTYKPAPVAA